MQWFFTFIFSEHGWRWTTFHQLVALPVITLTIFYFLFFCVLSCTNDITLHSPKKYAVIYVIISYIMPNRLLCRLAKYVIFNFFCYSKGILYLCIFIYVILFIFLLLLSETNCYVMLCSKTSLLCCDFPRI